MGSTSRWIGALAIGAAIGCADLGMEHGEVSSEIVGGVPATEYPEAVIVDGTGTRCSGVLLAPRLVLTAAHCVYGPQTYTVTAPNAPGSPTVDVLDHTHYDSPWLGNGLIDPEHHDLAVLQLAEPISIAAYPTRSRAPVAGQTLRLIGRVQDGTFTDSPFVSAARAPDPGEDRGWPLDYTLPGALLESGDSGGAAIVDGTTPHAIAGVNSGTIYEAPIADLIARIDLEPIASWLDRLVAACGALECDLPIRGYVDAGAVTAMTCPPDHTLREFAPLAWVCFPNAGGGGISPTYECPGEADYVFWESGASRCMRSIELSGEAIEPRCPNDAARYPAFIFYRSAPDICATDPLTIYPRSGECDGIPLGRMGHDVCIRCREGQVFDGESCAPRPMAVRDVSGVLRDGSVSRTQYYLSANASRPGDWTYVHLVGSTGSQHSYPGAARDGALLVAHTFDSVAPSPFTTDLSYVSPDGRVRTVTAYFPAFTTTGGRKMFFYVAEDGTTFYADPEHDGISYSRELLTAAQAIRREHLAARRPDPTTACPEGHVLHNGVCMWAIEVVSATYGASCGRENGNLTAQVARACDGQVYCNYVVPAAIHEPCDGGFRVEWTCGSTPHVYSIDLPPGASLETATLYCD